MYMYMYMYVYLMLCIKLIAYVLKVAHRFTAENPVMFITILTSYDLRL